MNVYRHTLGFLTIFSSLTLLNCGGVGLGPPHISISPHPATIAVNSTVTFTATLSGDNNNTPRWYLMTPGYGANLGSPTQQTGGVTFVYTAPPTPPVYENNMNSEAGTVTLVAEIGYSGGTISGGADETRFTITAPSVTVGISPTTASVALGSTQTFYGYAVGSVNNLMTVQVNGVTGGSVATGTIAPTLTPGTYTYTAPSSMPMSGSTVTITIISQADPTKTQSAVVILH